MFINHTSKQVTAKIVYYGTGLSGKTTNLQYIYSVTNPKSRGELVSMETDIERTLFFDLLPIDVGSINGYQTKFQLYTVPGQIFYDATRKIVLKGVDGIVFVGDSQELMTQGNIDSFENLKKNLLEHNIDIDNIPIVMQYNKRDLKNILSIDVMNQTLNTMKFPYFEAIATTGMGIIDTLKKISSLTLLKIKKEIDSVTNAKLKPTPIKFDTDTNQKIKRIEEIPQKKINVENVEDLALKIEVESDSKIYEAQKPMDETIRIKREDLNIPQMKSDKAEAAPSPPPPQKEVKPKTVKAPSPSQAISELTRKKTNPEPKKKKSKKADLISKDHLKILDNLNDNTRKTIIKKVKFNDISNTVEIKDENSEIIKSFKLNISPNTKKVTIIIDVEQ